jgi:hypothetical protein|tara:strand:- start:230 stop:415 length:186 start_codon:yes stop_codon:yes gene_type:complete
MNHKEVDELGILLKQAQKEIDNMMSNLSEGDKTKVNNIVDGIDKTNEKEMETYIKNQKDAS